MSNVKSGLSLGYRWLRAYITFLVNKVYYKDVTILGRENVPEDGTPLLIVSDHQNSLNDALGIVLSLQDRKVHFITRADIFAVHPLVAKFIYSLGGLPAFRLSHEGEGALQNNDSTFKVSEQNLLEGKSVIIYPEAGHQNKHWLGTFSYGYTKLAFEAAEMGNFEKEIFIMPSCNHYSDYFGLRTQQLIKYGTPVSIKPYYELYKTKPRTAQRQVNAIVREQIKSMMLSVDDVQNYEAVDYIRQSKYGSDYAVKSGYNPELLEEKLASDKKLTAALDKVGEETPQTKEEIYSKVLSLTDGMKKAGIKDAQFEDAPTVKTLVLSALAILITFPLAMFCLWPTVLSWLIPMYLSKKVGDRMLEGSFVMGLNLIVVIPIAALITLITCWIKFSLLTALLYVAAFPLIFLFSWTYSRWIKRFVEDLRFMKALRNGTLAGLESLRQEIYSSLDKVLENK